MNYGKIEEWKAHSNGGTCAYCSIFSDGGFYKQCKNTCTITHSCLSCYIEHVVTPNTEPITEVTEDLIGRDVVCTDTFGKDDRLVLGKEYVIAGVTCGQFVRIDVDDSHHSFFNYLFRLLPEKNETVAESPGPTLEPLRKWSDSLIGKVAVGICYPYKNLKVVMSHSYDGKVFYEQNSCATYVLNQFALYAGESDKKQEQPDDCSEKRQETPEPETTHSATLQFPNGDMVEIPAPEGEGWESEVVIEYKKESDTWPEEVNNIGFKAGVYIEDKNYPFKHKNAQVVAADYLSRTYIEKPHVLLLTKWTRAHEWKPAPKEKTFEEIAIERYPSRIRSN